MLLQIVLKHDTVVYEGQETTWLKELGKLAHSSDTASVVIMTNVLVGCNLSRHDQRCDDYLPNIQGPAKLLVTYWA